MNKETCDSCKDRRKQRRRESNRLYDKNIRDKESTSFYKSKAWKVKRLQALERDHYLCVHCFKRNKMKKADMVDHIIPIKEDWSLRLSLSNLQSLCNQCHNIKTAEDERKYG